MENKNNLNIDENNVKVIKIGKKALFEFIYEKFIQEQEMFFDINAIDVSSDFHINWNTGEFIFCVYKSEDNNGNFVELSKSINLQKLIENLPNSTDSMFSKNRYDIYTKNKLIELSK